MMKLNANTKAEFSPTPGRIQHYIMDQLNRIHKNGHCFCIKKVEDSFQFEWSLLGPQSYTKNQFTLQTISPHKYK